MADLIGQTFKGYQVVSLLGQGGMAVVYKAYQSTMDRYVALKVMLDAFSEDETFAQRFKQEASLIARLEHAHILPVYDTGEAEGRLYIVMRLVDTGTLANLVAGQPMALPRMRRIIEQVAGALDYAHQHGVVHRDIKPTNILIDSAGNALLTDFGIAKDMESTAGLTGSGGMLGTPLYMSPEQVKGERLDSRSDVYSLGVMAYQLAVGRVPFSATTPMAVAVMHVNNAPPAPRALNPALPETVEHVILRAIAKNPADRFATAGQMAVALNKAADATQRAHGGSTTVVDGPPPGLPHPPPSRTAQAVAPQRQIGPPQTPAAPPEQPPAKRGFPWLWVVGGGAVLAVLACAVVAGVALGLWGTGTGGPFDLGGVAGGGVPATADNVVAATVAAVATEQATNAPATQAQVGTVPAATDGANAVNDASTVEPTATSFVAATDTPGVANSLIVFDREIASGNTEIFVMQADGSLPTRLTNNSGIDAEADLSPDGNWIVYESQRSDGSYDLIRMRRDGSSASVLTLGREADWHPNGNEIAFESTDQDIFIMEVNAGGTPRLVMGGARAPSWSPDGTQLAVMVPDGSGLWQIAVLNLLTGNAREVTSGSPSKRFPVWSPDGQEIAYNTLTSSGAPDHIWAMAPDGTRQRQITTSGSNGRPAWSPDGNYLLFNSNRNGRWQIFRIDRDGGNVVQLSNGNADQRADWGS